MFSLLAKEEKERHKAIFHTAGKKMGSVQCAPLIKHVISAHPDKNNVTPSNLLFIYFNHDIYLCFCAYHFYLNQ